MIYHITSRSAWTAARIHGIYQTPSLESEGFIHCSTREQLLSVADSIFRGQADLLVLCIDESRLRARLRWEAPAHPKSPDADPKYDDLLFPHLYGALNLEAVVEVFDFEETEAGFALPPDLPG